MSIDNSNSSSPDSTASPASPISFDTDFQQVVSTDTDALVINAWLIAPDITAETLANNSPVLDEVVCQDVLNNQIRSEKLSDSELEAKQSRGLQAVMMGVLSDEYDDLEFTTEVPDRPPFGAAIDSRYGAKNAIIVNTFLLNPDISVADAAKFADCHPTHAYRALNECNDGNLQFIHKYDNLQLRYSILDQLRDPDSPLAHRITE